MLGALRKHLHLHVREHLHSAWVKWSIRLYEGVKTFVHAIVWFTGLIFLLSHLAASAIQAGYHLTNVWSNSSKLTAINVSLMGWQELLALASIPAGIMAIYSVYTAYERWHMWAKYGHHLDQALSPPAP